MKAETIALVVEVPKPAEEHRHGMSGVRIAGANAQGTFEDPALCATNLSSRRGLRWQKRTSKRP
jgi:hypothetical protein